MKIQIWQFINWQIIKGTALATIGKQLPRIVKPVSSEWKKKAVISGHSINYFSEMVIEAEMPYKVANHFVRHNKTKGFYANFTTQRPEITNKKRDPDELVTIIIKANPNAIIEVSHERLCNRSAVETRKAWIDILMQIKLHEPELVLLCVPKCAQQGYCSEKFQSCNWNKTDEYEVLRNCFLDYVRS